MAPADCQRVIETMDAAMLPCSTEEAARLVVELLASHPERAKMKAEKDYPIYCVRLGEAFQMFPYDVGKMAIDGGSGIPSKHGFKPKPADIISFCKAEVDRRADLKIMAQRHITEFKRRQEEKAEEAKFERTPERQAEIQAKIAELRNHRNSDGFVLAQDQKASRV